MLQNILYFQSTNSAFIFFILKLIEYSILKMLHSAFLWLFIKNFTDIITYVHFNLYPSKNQIV